MVISVIIPLYNKAAYIEKAVLSVLNQTFKQFELIIVDDGSTDDGLERVRHSIKNKKYNEPDHQTGLNEYVNRLAQLKKTFLNIIEQQNAGVSVARNNGVKAAQYDYIAFLDADDWWDPNFLEEMAGLIENFPEAALYGCNYYYVKNGKYSLKDKGLPPDFISGYIDYFELYSSNFIVPFNCSFVVVKKDSFNAVGGFNSQLKFAEDFDLWVRMSLKYKVAYLNRPLAYSNQDVPVQFRALGNSRKWKTSEHLIFNLGYLRVEEDRNPILKKLLDGLRVRSLVQFHLANLHLSEVQKILSRVDFSKQPPCFRRIYHWPRHIVKVWFTFKAIGSLIKQTFIRIAKLISCDTGF